MLQPQAGSAQFQPDGKCTAPTAYQVHGHLRLRPRAQDAVSDRAAGGRRRSRPRVQDAVAIEQEEKQAGSGRCLGGWGGPLSLSQQQWEGRNPENRIMEMGSWEDEAR